MRKSPEPSDVVKRESVTNVASGPFDEENSHGTEGETRAKECPKTRTKPLIGHMRKKTSKQFDAETAGKGRGLDSPVQVAERGANPHVGQPSYPESVQAYPERGSKGQGSRLGGRVRLIRTPEARIKKTVLEKVKCETRRLEDR